MSKTVQSQTLVCQPYYHQAKACPLNCFAQKVTKRVRGSTWMTLYFVLDVLIRGSSLNRRQNLHTKLNEK